MKTKREKHCDTGYDVFANLFKRHIIVLEIECKEIRHAKDYTEMLFYILQHNIADDFIIANHKTTSKIVCK